jgi:phosphoenolpyruvate carboxykinase (GTP)
MYDMRRLLSVDRELWLQECEDAREYYEKIGKVPPELYEELDALEMRLNRGYKVKHE